MQTQEEFQRHSARLEQLASTSPTAYRLRVMLLGALGYAYIFDVLALLIGAVGTLAWLLAGHGGGALLFKLGLPAPVLVATVLRRCG